METDKKIASGIKIVHPHDVLAGRGNGVQNHQGNIFYRELIHDHKFEYITAARDSKIMLCELVYERITNRSPPGRFLKRDSRTKQWNEMSRKDAIKKIGQAFREGASLIIETLTDENRGQNNEEGTIHKKDLLISKQYLPIVEPMKLNHDEEIGGLDLSEDIMDYLFEPSQQSVFHSSSNAIHSKSHSAIATSKEKSNIAMDYSSTPIKTNTSGPKTQNEELLSKPVSYVPANDLSIKPISADVISTKQQNKTIPLPSSSVNNASTLSKKPSSQKQNDFYPTAVSINSSSNRSSSSYITSADDQSRKPSPSQSFDDMKNVDINEITSQTEEIIQRVRAFTEHIDKNLRNNTKSEK